MTRITALLALTTLFATTAHAGVAGIQGVGSNSCNYATIQDAINAASPGDIVRVYTTTTDPDGDMLFTPPAELLITKDLMLAAGNSLCEGNHPISTMLATIDPVNHGGRTMRISGTSGNNLFVDLVNLKLVDGTTTGNGGNLLIRWSTVGASSLYVYDGQANNGGNVHAHESSLTMDGGCIRRGTATSMGGGISAWNTAPRNNAITLNNAIVAGNTAGTVGGGLRMQAGGFLRLTGEGEVSDNSAGTDGGGVFAAGSFGIGNGSLSGEYSSKVLQISANTAGDEGGGLALLPNTSFDDSYVMQVLVEDNVASDLGGGFFVDGGYPLFISHTMVRANGANIDGGGMYIIKGGDVRIEEGVFDKDALLSEFVDNGAERGAGIFMETAELDLEEVSFRGQYLTGTNTDEGLDLHIIDEGSANLFRVLAETTTTKSPSLLAENDSKMEMEHVTVANDSKYGVLFRDNAVGSFDSSILDGKDIAFEAAASYSAQCSLIITGYVLPFGSLNTAGSLIGIGYTPAFTGDYEPGVGSDALGLACSGIYPNAGARD